MLFRVDVPRARDCAYRAHKSLNPAPYHLANSLEIAVTACKLAHAQAIGWALWCLWTATALVLAYAFSLGIATPLLSPKRGASSRISSARVGDSAIIRPAVSRLVRSSFARSQVSTTCVTLACGSPIACRSPLVA